MRQRPDWMSPTDDLILQTLADSDLVLTPAVLAYNLDISRDHVNRRLSKFVEAGLVNRPDRGYYILSETGEQYLTGDLDASELEDE